MCLPTDKTSFNTGADQPGMLRWHKG